MKKIIIAAIAAATFSGTAHAEGITAGPKAGVFFGNETSLFYGVEANKKLDDSFTVGASIMVGEVETRHTATSTVLIPQEPITITPPPIVVTPEPIKVDCNKPAVESKEMVTLCDQVKPKCEPVIVQPDPITVQPEDIVYQPEPKKEVRKRTVKRQADVVIAMLHGKYKLTGPLSLKGGAGMASIDGDKSLALSGGVSLDLPVSDKLTAGLTAEYLRLADDISGAMLTASLQYRF